MPIWEAVHASNPDVFVFLGDNIYGDSEDPEVLRAKYAELQANVGVQRVLSKTYALGTWDDHDYGANDAGSEYPSKVASQGLFLDFMRVPQDSPRRAREGVYHAEILGEPGRRVQFLMLDTRYHRSNIDQFPERPRGRGPYGPTEDATRVMLGEEQWEWLEAQLREPAEVRVLGSSIQLVAEDHGWEAWINHPHERERLLQLIGTTRAGGVVVLSGDRHAAEISRWSAPRDGRGPGYDLIDITASSMNHPRGWYPERNRHRLGDLYSGPNFGTLAIDWKGADTTIQLAIHGADGATILRHRVGLRDLQPPPEPEVLIPERLDRIALGSCNNQNYPTPLWEPLLATNPDLFLFLGDNIYGDTPDMDKLRAAYALLDAQPGFAKLRASVPILATWDDHDYGMNDVGREWPMKEQSKDVFMEFFDVPEDSPRRGRSGIYGSWCFGPPEQRVQVLLLDLRTHRSPWGIMTREPEPGGCCPGHYSQNLDPGATILGDEQWEWLEERLRVPAAVRIIGSSLQCLPQGHVWECWNMIPGDRQRLFNTIRDTRANGVVVVSGDTHWAELTRVVPADSGVRYPLWEMTTSGLNQGWRFTNIVNRHRVDVPLWESNFGLLTFDWDAPNPTLTMEARGENDRSLKQVVPFAELRAPSFVR
jgi:alkaline phosphatase D